MSRLSNSPDVINEAQGFLAALGFGTQGVNVVDVVAATASNPAAPAALTASNPTAPAALSQIAAPAGGSGATGGAYDTAGNRDLAIASINAARADIIALRAEVVTYEVAISALVADAVATRTEIISYEVAISALIVDNAELRTKVNAIISSLETGGVLASS